MNHTDGRLSLDDPRWSELKCRSGSAAHVPEELRYLLAHPHDLEKFTELWPYLCSEGTTWSAAYATTPYVIDIAKQLPAKDLFEHVFFIGVCQMDGVEERDCPEYLLEAHRQAVEDALPLVGTVVPCNLSSRDTLHLLATIAALKGYPKLSDMLDRLECGCPHCDGELLPSDEFDL